MHVIKTLYIACMYVGIPSVYDVCVPILYKKH